MVIQILECHKWFMRSPQYFSFLYYHICLRPLACLYYLEIKSLASLNLRLERQFQKSQVNLENSCLILCSFRITLGAKICIGQSSLEKQYQPTGYIYPVSIKISEKRYWFTIRNWRSWLTHYRSKESPRSAVWVSKQDTWRANGCIIFWVQKSETQESWWCHCSLEGWQGQDPGRASVSVQTQRQERADVPVWSSQTGGAPF